MPFGDAPGGSWYPEFRRARDAPSFVHVHDPVWGIHLHSNPLDHVTLADLKLKRTTVTLITEGLRRHYGVTPDTVPELTQFRDAELSRIPGFDSSTARELTSALAAMGTQLGAFDLHHLAPAHRLAVVRLGVSNFGDLPKFWNQISALGLSESESEWLIQRVMHHTRPACSTILDLAPPAKAKR